MRGITIRQVHGKQLSSHLKGFATHSIDNPSDNYGANLPPDVACDTNDESSPDLEINESRSTYFAGHEPFQVQSCE